MASGAAGVHPSGAEGCVMIVGGRTGASLNPIAAVDIATPRAR